MRRKSAENSAASQMALLGGGGDPIPSPLSWQTARHTIAIRPTYSKRACECDIFGLKGMLAFAPRFFRI